MASLHGIQGMDREQIEYFLEQARSMLEVLERPVAKVPVLRGKKIAMLFFESSTRTRMSFELAAKSLGADVMNFSAQTSSMSKGETVLDTAKTIRALGAQAVVVRAENAGTSKYLADQLDLPVINAGDGSNEHPTQALLDLAVLDQEWNGVFKNKTLAIVGDVARSRVARSHLWAAQALGLKIRLVGPRTFWEPGLAQAFNVELHDDIEAGIQGVDAILALRIQEERRQGGGPYIPKSGDYYRRYGLTKQRLDSTGKDTLLLHPGPVNRGVEISHTMVYDLDRSRIERQVTMGVAVRMAALYWALGEPN